MATTALHMIDGTNYHKISVLLIEDERSIAEPFANALNRSGFETSVAGSWAEALATLSHGEPDVVLLDLSLPDADGRDICRQLRGDSDVPIIMVTASGSVTDRVVGLELGADDYIAKPVQLREMVARIRAVHRRTHARAPGRPPRTAATVHHVGPFRVDLQRRSVVDGEVRPIVLTGAEFAALQTLLEAAGEPVSRERLSEAALRRPWRPEDRSIDQLIFSLRRKLSDDDRGQRLIQSVRGAGYILISDVGTAFTDES
jgi:two-component system OmpR family response regulator